MDCFEIEGKPIPWKRARRCGNRYFDAQLKEKEYVQLLVKRIAKRVLSPNEKLKVKMWFIMPIPKSWSKKRRLKAIGEPHGSRPDVDNLAKFINDTLNGILWHDDAQIATLELKKTYGDEPKTIIQVESYGNVN